MPVDKKEIGWVYSGPAAGKNYTLTLCWADREGRGRRKKINKRDEWRNAGLKYRLRA
jgi:hypothetical protein